MPDLIREVRRATLSELKAAAALTTLVPAADIYPSTVPAGHGWPFIRWDAPTSIPIDLACVRGANVSFLVHAFAKPRYNGDDMIETAEDHVSRIVSAMHKVLHRNRLVVDGGHVRLRCQDTRIVEDGAEADAFHGYISVAGRALAA